MIRWLHTLKQQLRQTLRRPGAQLTRGQRFLRLCVDLARHARQELRDDSATTLAAALTYRTIFGLIPMIVMALIVFRAFGGFDNSTSSLSERVYDLLRIQVDLAESTSGGAADPIDTTPAPPTEALAWFGGEIQQALEAAYNQAVEAPEKEEERAKAEANARMKQQIDTLLNDLGNRATSVKVGSIGVVGMLILIWAALGLVVTVEKTFNVIYKAPQGRPWHVRIPIYWAVITLGPVLIWASYSLSTRLVEAVEGVRLLGGVLGLLSRFSALLVTWVLFLLLFKLMPNAKVAVRPALAGALVSALAWELMKAALRWYIDTAVINPTQTQLYGSLALLPLLLFWVYMTWMVVLAGLEVTHILQTLPANRMGVFEQTRPTPVARDPWLVIPVMSAVAESFDAGKPIGVSDLADRLSSPASVVGRVVDELTQRGLLHQIPDEDGPPRVTLAMPPSRIRIADLVAAASAGIGRDELPGHNLLAQLARAQDAALADLTLADERPA